MQARRHGPRGIAARVIAPALLSTFAGMAAAAAPPNGPAAAPAPPAVATVTPPVPAPQKASAAPATVGTIAVPEPDDRAAEIAAVMSLIKSTVIEERMKGCESLPYSGITDKALFDTIDAMLEDRYQKAVTSNEMAEFDVARCVQALASSGDMKYMDTIELWVQAPRNLLNKNARKYVAGRAPALLANSAQWNPIINSTANHVAGRSWPETRVVNMVKSSNPALQREGLRRIVHHKEFAGLMPVVEAQLLASYQSVTEGTPGEDSLAWMCKTLGQSHDPKFEGTLTKVAETATSTKLQKHAHAAIKILHTPPAGDVAADDKEE